MNTISKTFIFVIPICLVSAGFAADQNRGLEARKILETSGVRGGLVVHLGCGDGRLTAALHANDSYVVQGLDGDPKNVEHARLHVQSLGCYGAVSILPLRGAHLPYADRLANLVVAEDLGAVPMTEVMRILAPLGAACIKSKGEWTKTEKSWPNTIDEWTHFQHGPDNNPVAHDTEVGPPKRLQWVANPLWTRSHEMGPSIYGVVSASGRLFYVEDEGPRGFVDERLPEKWSLLARDAFNGVLLWRQSLAGWKSGNTDWRHMDWRVVPSDLNRRLVAVNDRLYLACGTADNVRAYDAATGKPVTEYPDTKGAEELVCHNGVLLVFQGHIARLEKGDKSVASRIDAFDAVKGTRLWSHSDPVIGCTMAADGGRAFYATDKEIVSLDLLTGKQVWRTPGLQSHTSAKRFTSKPGVLLVHDNMVVVNYSASMVLSLAAETGTQLWTKSVKGESVLGADMFANQGVLWPGNTDGLSLKTGDPMRSALRKETGGHHARCYPRVATENYLIFSKRGIEFFHQDGKTAPSVNDWVRGECRVGVRPCNGLVYATPHACYCSFGAMLHGFYGLAPDKDTVMAEPTERLERGPAWNNVPERLPTPDEWPTYRHDAARSGGTTAVVPDNPHLLWNTDVGGKVSPPVVAGERVLVSAVDTHTVHCLNAVTGQTVWRYLAGARVDSPPSVFRGFVLFGCRDGWVYCLRFTDGQLVWRFLAAPREQFVGAFDRFESAWPVHGSLLIHNGIAYALAGRSAHLDDGMWLYALDPATGAVRIRTQLQAKELQGKTANDYMPGALTDIISADSDHLFLGKLTFDTSLKPAPPKYSGGRGEQTVPRHLMAMNGFLDDTWHNRTFWIYGDYWTGHDAAVDAPRRGHILVFDGRYTYGVNFYQKFRGYSVQFKPGESYKLFADDNNTRLEEIKGKPWEGPKRVEPVKWSANIPVRMRALALAGNRLWAAGPPDVIDPADPYGTFEGRGKAMLMSFSTADGSKVFQQELEHAPVFDGLIAAGGRLYISTQFGKVVCWGRK